MESEKRVRKPSWVVSDHDNVAEPAIRSHKRQAETSAGASFQGSDDIDFVANDDEEPDSAPPRKQLRTQISTSSLGEDGSQEQDLDSKTSSIEEKQKDIHPFFEKPVLVGKTKKVRCKLCRNAILLVNEVSTLRRHMQAQHQAAYYRWIEKVNIKSMLPRNRKKKAEQAAQQATQATLNSHLGEKPVKECIIKYMDAVFKQAAIEWLAATNQLISAVEHPKFIKMVTIASRAEDGVKIPTTKDRFVSNKAREVSLTCNAWQASNANAYFATTSHWVEETAPGVWELQSALIGFTQMNTLHDGVCLGRALYQVVKCLQFQKKVGWVTCDNTSNNGNGKVGPFVTSDTLLGSCYQLSHSSIPLDIQQEHAERLKEFINNFLYLIARDEKDDNKKQKLCELALSDDEWKRVKELVCLNQLADSAQHAFSTETEPALHHGLPALEALHAAWSSHAEKEKYSRYAPALHAGINKILEYYEKTSTSHAYALSMVLNPNQKMPHFDSHWPKKTAGEVKKNIEVLLKYRHQQMFGDKPQPLKAQSSHGHIGRLLEELSSSDEEDDSQSLAPVPAADSSAPWKMEFNCYLDSPTNIGDMPLVRWWGLNTDRYPVWSSLARDHLAIMASSVSNIVEALQFLKVAIQQNILFCEEEVTLAEEELEQLECDDGDPDWVDVDKDFHNLSIDDDSD
ncbi:hypothetical protein NP233_g9835 [Leucocoprinus birnbaumii]|uniref:HAT C-terminal dimerisation domain-containing protein n=1 Tax=Leucocoprinus birnbaumii TaxID=56174 RepID=A0AAD5VJP2_9AGAR|nr:hypothetical protein NP233_g9835 [Leucocoprinus birnbaumii]